MRFFIVLCVVGLVAGGGWYYWQQESGGEDFVSQQEESRIVPVTKPASEAEPKSLVKSEPDPKPEPDPAPEKKPDAIDAEKMATAAIVEKPVEPEPVAAPQKKSDLDALLEQTYPVPDFKPLIELVENWNNVPERAFPPEITVNLPLEYQLRQGSTVIGKSNQEAGHLAVPLKFKPGSLLVSAKASPEMRAVVAIEDTNFKKRVEVLYEEKVEMARQRVYAKREEMRAEVAASLALAKNSANPNAAEMTPVTRTPLESEIASSYGKSFRGDYFPELRNGKDQKYDQEMPLGPVGGKMAVVYDQKEAKIVELWDRGPGSKAGLKVGDVIVEANGKKFASYSGKSGDGPDGAPETIGLAIVDSQSSGRPLELGILRGGEESLIQVELPELPAFSETFPQNCQRSAALIESAAQWLADNQKDDGMWPSNQYSSAWCGLSLLATGDPKYKREIKKAARAFADKFEMGKAPSQSDLIEKTGGLDNWQNCMVGIFLAEYLLATGDEAVLEALISNCRRMEARIQAETGRLGHSSDNLPYSEKGLVIINVHAHIMWALAAQYQELEWDWTPWDLSFKAVEAAMTQEAAVGYNFSARSGSQSGSRTGAMATALALSERESSTMRKMGSWLTDHHREFPNTHAMTSLGIVFGFAGIKNAASEKDLRKCLDDYRWMYSLVTPGNLDHGSYYYGCRSNHGGDGYCNRRLVGNWVTLISLTAQRDDTLWMFGNRDKGWYE